MILSLNGALPLYNTIYAYVLHELVAVNCGTCRSRSAFWEHEVSAMFVLLLLLLLLVLNFITDSLLHTCAGKYDSCPNYKDYNKDTTLVF